MHDKPTNFQKKSTNHEAKSEAMQHNPLSRQHSQVSTYKLNKARATKKKEKEMAHQQTAFLASLTCSVCACEKERGIFWQYQTMLAPQHCLSHFTGTHNVAKKGAVCNTPDLSKTSG